MNKQDIKPLLLILLITSVFIYQYNLLSQYNDNLMQQLHADDPINHYQYINDKKSSNIYWVTTFPSMDVSVKMEVSWILNFTAFETSVTIKIDGMQYGQIDHSNKGSLIISDITGNHDIKIIINGRGIEMNNHNGYIIDLYLW